MEPQGKNIRPAGAFGPDVLTPQLSLDTHLKKKIPNYLKENIRRGDGERLHLCAQNMARQYGFTVESPVPRVTKDITGLIEELREKSGEGICLHMDKSGALRLSHGTYASDGWKAYFIPLAPTFSMPEGTGHLIRRFLLKFSNRYHIGDITKKGYYDWTQDWLECQMEKYDNNPEYFEDTKREDYDIGKEYKEDGEMAKIFQEWKSLPPLTLKELKAFKAATKEEKQMKHLMLQAWELMKSNFNPWDYTTLNSTFQTEDIDVENTSFIRFEDTIAIIFDYDEFISAYADCLNQDVECGVETEVL